MNIKEIFIRSFLNFKIGSTMTKGAIYRNAAKSIPNLKESTAGWLISNWLINKGHIVEVGRGKDGAKIYRKIS